VGIDYIIHYDCEPKRALTTAGLLERLKGRDQARAVIELYRDEGDQRPLSKIGFERVRRLPDGTQESELVIAQDLVDAAEELTPWEAHCAGCPANRTGIPFGCTGTINYPISIQAERWLLDRLPGSDHPLPFVLLQRAIHEHGYTGETAASLRAREGMFLGGMEPLARDLGAVRVSGDQVFELLFLSGPIRPAHGSLLLQFFGGISPDLDADVMMQLAAPPSRAWIDEHVPFLHTPNPVDDTSIIALKAFFRAIHIAFCLSVPLLLDV
jgi:hypothetical protein